MEAPGGEEREGWIWLGDCLSFVFKTIKTRGCLANKKYILRHFFFAPGWILFIIGKFFIYGDTRRGGRERFGLGTATVPLLHRPNFLEFSDSRLIEKIKKKYHPTADYTIALRFTQNSKTACMHEYLLLKHVLNSNSLPVKIQYSLSFVGCVKLYIPIPRLKALPPPPSPGYG